MSYQTSGIDQSIEEMRKTITQLRSDKAWLSGELAEKEKDWAKIFTDLNQNHQSLLERLKEAEVLLGDDSLGWMCRYNPDWLKRRDALLNPTNKDVK